MKIKTREVGCNFGWVADIVNSRRTIYTTPTYPHEEAARLDAVNEPVGYATEGDVRGSCGHVHRNLMTAMDCLKRDRDACKSVGGYSDRHVVCILYDGKTRQLSLDEAEEEDFLTLHIF